MLRYRTAVFLLPASFEIGGVEGLTLLIKIVYNPVILINQLNKQEIEMFKKGSKFQVTKDQLHSQSIFANSMSEQPIVTVALKAGAVVTAKQDFQEGYMAVEVVTDGGAYFHIPADELKPVMN